MNTQEHNQEKEVVNALGNASDFTQSNNNGSSFKDNEGDGGSAFQVEEVASPKYASAENEQNENFHPENETPQHDWDNWHGDGLQPNEDENNQDALNEEHDYPEAAHATVPPAKPKKDVGKLVKMGILATAVLAGVGVYLKPMLLDKPSQTEQIEQVQSSTAEEAATSQTEAVANGGSVLPPDEPTNDESNAAAAGGSIANTGAVTETDKAASEVAVNASDVVKPTEPVSVPAVNAASNPMSGAVSGAEGADVVGADSVAAKDTATENVKQITESASAGSGQAEVTPDEMWRNFFTDNGFTTKQAQVTALMAKLEDLTGKKYESFQISDRQLSEASNSVGTVKSFAKAKPKVKPKKQISKGKATNAKYCAFPYRYRAVVFGQIWIQTGNGEQSFVEGSRLPNGALIKEINPNVGVVSTDKCKYRIG